MPGSQSNFLLRAQKLLVLAACSYIALLSLLLLPPVQKHAIFMHAVLWPLFVNYSMPADYGLPAHRTVDLKIETPDNVILGAWLILAEDHRIPDTALSGPPADESINASLRTKPTVLLLHGNTGARAVGFRIQHYLTYSSRLGANVLAIDYRGFGDSTGTPSEQGVKIDAKAAWNWLLHQGAASDDILIVGHSLGTGVASLLAEELSEEGLQSRGLVLLAPFTSVEHLLDNYWMFGFIPPPLQPLEAFPSVKKFIGRFIHSRFDTHLRLPTVNVPILLAHAENDHEVQPFHSKNLFDILLDPILPPPPTAPSGITEISSFDWKTFYLISKERHSVRESIVSTQEIDGVGKIQSFRRREGDEMSRVVFINTKSGAHDKVGLEEGVIDIIAKTFDLKVEN